MSNKPPITDSPWLWFGLFAGMGLFLLAMTGGKYGRRQSGLERKAQARMAAAQGLEITEDVAGRKSSEGTPEYSDPNQTKIPLYPLAITLGLIFSVCVVMLVREIMSAAPPGSPTE